MPYPSLMTIWNGAEDSRRALDLAADLAFKWSAHLEIVCLGVDRASTGFYGMELAHEMINDLFGQAVNEAEAHAKDVRGMMKGDSAKWAIRPAAVRFAELQNMIGKSAWFQDLIILPAPFGGKDEELSEAILNAALFGSSTPVLVTPNNEVEAIGKRILLAWNGSPESIRAMRAAMPLLRTADMVEAATIGAPANGCKGIDPGFALGVMLSRHGVEATTAHLPRTATNVADALQQRADEIQADMIVMGAYGHSRFRERMIGGATRDMLMKAELPVFFAR